MAVTAETPVAEAPAAAAAAPRHAPSPRRSEGLTLARAFDLMRSALAELPSPASHEALRNRMAALFGRQDAMLDADRFPRLLRQAHDAEIADVRKVGDDEFEVVARGVEPAPPQLSLAMPAVTERNGEAEAAPVAGAGSDAAAARGGIRFRRGSRAAAAPPAIAMVGVVSLDEPAADEPKKGRAPRKKVVKEDAAPETEAPAKKKSAAPRARGKKKAE